MMPASSMTAMASTAVSTIARYFELQKARNHVLRRVAMRLAGELSPISLYDLPMGLIVFSG
jgi:hypothetical protein